MTDSAKSQNVFWWIASIAVSVLCCAILFVVFACYLSEVKSSVQNNEDRIAVIQEREDRILAEIEMIRKHIQPDAAVEGQVAPAAGVPDAAGVNGVIAPMVGAAPSSAPVPTTVAPAAPVAPAVSGIPAVPVSPTGAPAPNAAHPAPAVSVPAMPAPSDKK